MKIIKNIAMYASFLLVLVVLTGCPNFLSPVRGFLDEYTNTAAVAEVTYSRSVPQDGSGVTCLSSAESCTISFMLRNPQGYTLQPSVVLVSGTPLNPADYTLALAADKKSVTLTFSQMFLAAHDMGGDISVTVGLYEPATGRNFPPYTLRLKANTPPPVPQGGCIMADASNHYVVCFNLDLGTIHGDLKSIEVNGYSTTVTSSVGPSSLSFVNSAFTTVNPGSLTPLGVRPAFAAGSGTIVPVYLVTNEIVNANNNEYRITITDTAGFSTSYSLWTLSDFLGPVKVTNASGVELDDGSAVDQDVAKATGTVLINAPTTTDQGAPVVDVNVYYQIYFDAGYSNLYISGNFTGAEASVDIPPVPVYIKAWAQKNGYTDSVTKQISVRANAVRLCVDENSTSGIVLGTESYPYKSISAAIVGFTSASDLNNTIYLQANITSEVNISVNGLVLTIEGNKHGDRMVFDGKESNRCFTLDAGDVTVRNVIFKNGKVIGASGGGILVQNSSSRLTLNNCDIINNTIDNSMHMGGAGISIGYGAKVIMENCTVSDNTMTNATNGAYGGGIHLVTSGQNTTLNMTACTIKKNITSNAGSAPGYGGGIFISGSGASATLVNCVIQDNTAATGSSGNGGGIYITEDGASINLMGCTISNNIASEQSNGTGGGIVITSGAMASVSNVSINSNIATSSGNDSHTGNGGGVYLSNASLSVNNDFSHKIIGNYAVKSNDADFIAACGYGGGIYVKGGGAKLLITDCTIKGNTAATQNKGFGGGLAIEANARVEIVRATIESNSATNSIVNGHTGNGGGLYINNSFLIVKADGVLNLDANQASSSTVSMSAIGSGGGLYLEKVAITNNGTINITNNIASITRAGNGGGIYIATGEFELKNFIISGNIALDDRASYQTAGRGGGIYISTTTGNGVTISDSTIGSNIASNLATGEGGGIYINATASLKLIDSVITSNKAIIYGMGNGNGIYANSTFAMQGSASVDANNNVFLKNNLTINIIDDLTAMHVATLMPESPSNELPVLSGNTSLVNLGKFDLSPPFSNWGIDANGRLMAP